MNNITVGEGTETLQTVKETLEAACFGTSEERSRLADFLEAVGFADADSIREEGWSKTLEGGEIVKSLYTFLMDYHLRLAKKATDSVESTSGTPSLAIGTLIMLALIAVLFFQNWAMALIMVILIVILEFILSKC